MLTRLRRRLTTAMSSRRHRIQRLGPYQSLIVMLLPAMLVEPLKIVAVFIAGDGHWLTGTGIMIAAYGASLLVVERVFKIVKPKLMTLNWFASAWIWFTGMRQSVSAWLRALATKCRAVACER